MCNWEYLHATFIYNIFLYYALLIQLNNEITNDLGEIFITFLIQHAILEITFQGKWHMEEEKSCD